MNNWVESYLDALLSAGLSTEAARKAAEQERGAPDDVDGDNNVAAKYFTQQILAMDEESIQQAWMKVHARSNVRLAGDRDARLEHLCWRVWGMRRRAAALGRARPSLDGGASDDGPDAAALSELRSDDTAASGGGSGGGGSAGGGAAAGEGEAARLLGKRLSLLPRAGGGAAAAGELSSSGELSDAGGLTPTAGAPGTPAPATPRAAGGRPRGGGAVATSPVAAAGGAALDVGVNLGEGRVPKLYCVLISMHGLVRGEAMELGRDPDTGGQVKYVVELAKALSRHPAVHRVDLLTRLIRDPSVDKSYGEEEETLAPGATPLGGARIVRIAAGPTAQYVRKEALWPYVREFADNAMAHVAATMARLAAAGEVCELYTIHGHYGDAGEAAALMSFTLGADMVLTGHSLGRNKLDHLLKSRTMSRADIEATYAMSRRIEAEERALDAALMVFTSTQQEVKDQWGLYDGYDPALSAALAKRPRRGRHFPTITVVPPGLDFSNLKVDRPPDPWQQLAAASALSGPRSRRASLANTAALAATGGAAEDPEAAAGAAGQDAPSLAAKALAAAPPIQVPAPGVAPSAFAAAAGGALSPMAGGGGAAAFTEDPPIWQDIFRFLRNPRKPVILAMSRPDAKKNITTLVRAYGENRALRDIANLVLVMGNRKVIDGMAAGSRSVLEAVLKLVDAYDLYGSVAYPKAHTQDDISDIYLLPQRTRGVFANIALQEPFGLTLIEAAAHGVPIVATTNGGPVDIIHTLHNGILVEPTDHKAVGDAILRLLADSQLWDQCSASGRDNINAYSWPAHCAKCLSAIEAGKLTAQGRHKAQMRTTYSADVGDIADAVIAAEAAAANGANGAAANAAAAAGAAEPQGDCGGDPALRALSDLGLATSLPVVDAAPAAAAAAPGSPHSPAAAAAPVPPSPRARLSLDGGSRPPAPPSPAAGAGGALAPSPLSASRGAAWGAGGKTAKSAYAVLIIDGPTIPPAAAPLLAARGKALSALAAAAATTNAAAAAPAAPGAAGVGVASALPLQETLDALASAGLPPGAVDFVITSFGAQVWHCGGAAAAAARGAGAFVADAGYDALADVAWDKEVVEKKLRMVLEERGILAGLPGAPRGAAGALRAEVEAGGGAAHVRVSVRGAPGGAPPSAAALAALAARIRRRLRAGGVRTQVVALVGSDDESGAALHVTPLRAARALALRYLAMQHRVDVARLTLVCCARAAAGGKAVFAASDADDLVAGAQRVFVLPPLAAAPHGAADGAAGAAADGFSVDLGLYAHDGRVTLLGE